MQPNKPNKLLLKIVSKILANPIIQFFVDPVIPKFAVFYLQRYLNRYVKSGVIRNYTLQVQRLGKLYYKICFHALTVEKETNKTILNYATSKVEEILKQAIAQ